MDYIITSSKYGREELSLSRSKRGIELFCSRNGGEIQRIELTARELLCVFLYGFISDQKNFGKLMWQKNKKKVK